MKNDFQDNIGETVSEAERCREEGVKFRHTIHRNFDELYRTSKKDVSAIVCA